MSQLLRPLPLLHHREIIRRWHKAVSISLMKWEPMKKKHHAWTDLLSFRLPISHINLIRLNRLVNV